MYSFRSAGKEDFDFVRRLHRETMRDYVTQIWGWDEVEQEKLLRKRFDPSKMQIIRENEADIGLLQVEKRPNEWFLASIQILPGYQGRGLGGKIVRDLLSEAECERVTFSLTVLKSNPAKAFYERLGFVQTAEDDVRYYMKRGFTA